MIDSECAGMVPQNGDVAQEGNAVLHLHWGSWQWRFMLNDASIHTRPRNLTAVSRQESEHPIGRLIIVALDG